MSVAENNSRKNFFDLTNKRTAKRLVIQLVRDNARIESFLQLLGWMWIKVETPNVRIAIGNLINRAYRLTSSYKKGDDKDADTRFAVELAEVRKFGPTEETTAAQIITDIFPEEVSLAFMQMLAWLETNTSDDETLAFREALNRLIAMGFRRFDAFNQSAHTFAISLLPESEEAVRSWQEACEIYTRDLEVILNSENTTKERREWFIRKLLEVMNLSGAETIGKDDRDDYQRLADALNAVFDSPLLSDDLDFRLLEAVIDGFNELQYSSRRPAVAQLVEALRCVEEEEAQEAEVTADLDRLTDTLKAVFENPATPQELINLICEHINDKEAIRDNHLVDAYVESLKEKAKE